MTAAIRIRFVNKIKFSMFNSEGLRLTTGPMFSILKPIRFGLAGFVI